jgi:excisionase family DNA binding protein
MVENVSNAVIRETPLTVSEAAAELGVTTTTIRRWIASGELGALRLGRSSSAHYRVTRGELDRFVVQTTTEGGDLAA